MNFQEEFLKNVRKRFEVYKNLGEKTFEQLTDKDFFYRPSPESNSIAVIIQHMYGNLMSRFTNFLTEDGEKEWRKRDEEFEEMDAGRNDLISFWNTGWDCLMNAIDSLTPEDVTKTVHIRKEPMSVSDALLRALAHQSYHVGQIVYLGKEIRDREWKSLSIPKGQSKQFNEHMAKSKP